jgi:3-oxoadipate enol-lactonase
MPYLSVLDADLFYQERGSGPAALFVHGFALDHTMWLDQLRLLAPHRRCIALDLRGHGHSDGGLHPGDAAGRHVADVAAVLARLGGGVDLVGHSMGAHVALAVAAHDPSRLRSLTLLGVMPRDAYHFTDTRPASSLTRPKEEMAIRFASGMLAPEATLAVHARAVAMAMSLDWAIVYPIASEVPRLEEQPQVPVPIMLATGREDRITPPAECARLAAALGARFVGIPHSGHLAPVENPHAVSELLLRFWSSR